MIEHDIGCRSPIYDWPVSLEEVQRFLDTWFFSLSDDGYFYARPKLRSLSVSDVEAFLRRLHIVCGDDFPRLIAIDFSNRNFKPGEWRKCEGLLLEFARRIGALPVCENYFNCPMVVVLIRPSRVEK